MTRIVLIGCGAMNRVRFQATPPNPNAEMASIVDIIEDAGRHRAKKANIRLLISDAYASGIYSATSASRNISSD